MKTVYTVYYGTKTSKRYKKTQFVGHTPTQDGRPLYNQESNTLYIDTGAYKGKTLSAIRLTEKGELIETISKNTIKEDITG
jgi:serine/threonine protein phosphatase 1